MMTGNEPINTREDAGEGRNAKSAILKEARDRADYAARAWSANFTASRAEVSFLYGNQWPDDMVERRAAEDMPSLTINNLPTHIDQVLGDQRMARPQIEVHPADDADYDIRPEPETDAEAEDPGAIDTIKLSEAFEGLIRNIEYVSGAEMHYDQAFQQAVEGGFGWLRVVTDYESEASFNQEARIKYVRNRYAVLIDPASQEPDYSDANFAFIAERMKRTEFERRYPDAQIGELTEGMSWWGDSDHVTVTEYFRREPMTRKLLMMDDGSTHFEDEIKDVLDEMQEAGVTIVQERKVKTFRVLWSKITAHDVLEKDREWPGTIIPLAPVCGKWVDLDDGPHYRGLTRFAADAKRMHNYMMSAATARVALSPKAPWTGTAAMFAGYEDVWGRANRTNPAFLPFNIDPENPSMRPERVDVAAMPAAEIQMALNMSDMVKATIGQFDASLGAQSNETSGKAIMARQREGDVASYAFVDNLNRAICKIGRILVEIIPKIYDTERIIRVRHEDGTTQKVRINRTMLDDETGKEVLVNDLAVGRFDVVVKAGPSHTTQRMEATEALMEFIRAAPATAPAIMDILAMNMDWPGAQKVAERMRKMVPPNLLSKREREQSGQEAPEPTPEQQAEMAKAQAEMAKAEADMAMAQAKTAEAQAKMAEIQMMAEGGNQMAETVRAIVAEALADLAAQQQTETPEVQNA